MTPSPQGWSFAALLGPAEVSDDDDSVGGVALCTPSHVRDRQESFFEELTTNVFLPQDAALPEATCTLTESRRTEPGFTIDSHSSDTDIDMPIDVSEAPSEEHRTHPGFVLDSSSQSRSSYLEPDIPYGRPGPDLESIIRDTAFDYSWRTNTYFDYSFPGYVSTIMGPNNADTVYDEEDDQLFETGYNVIIQNDHDLLSGSLTESVTADDLADSWLQATSDSLDQHDDFEGNMKVTAFFEKWRVQFAFYGSRFPPIGEQAMLLEFNRMHVPRQISFEDIDGEHYDCQGIDWSELDAERAKARALRNSSYFSYRNLLPDGTLNPYLAYPAGLVPAVRGRQLPSSDEDFRFRRFMTQHKASLGQFQLRHLMAATSRNAVFYASTTGIVCADTTLNTSQCVMDFSKAALRRYPEAPKRISTLAAGNGVVVAGGYYGEYAMKSLYASNDGFYTAGNLTQTVNSITTHIHTYLDRRGGLPQAVFCSNDEKIRVLDCHTNKVVQQHAITWPVNCSATSPDTRLRLVVGDDTQPLILDADTGRQVAGLQLHHDYGFACDWSPDGRYMATGNQDGSVQIWDARNWDKPLTEELIGTELGGIRSLHFSPLGSGRPVLLMAEPADIISVVDAVTFDTRQRFDFFGEIGGAGFVPDGSSFFVANIDRTFGGLFEFERVNWGRTGSHTVSKARRTMPMKRPLSYDSDDSDDEEIGAQFVASHQRYHWGPDDERDNDDTYNVDIGARGRREAMEFENPVF